jgi:uncharacterized protein (TIGR00255 family)
MIFSMTGFGSACIEDDLGIFSVELKSINNRYLDFAFRLPGSLSGFEKDIRKELAGNVRRGRVDINVRWARKGEGLPDMEINIPLLEKMYNDVLSLEKKLGAGESFSLGDLLQNPSLYIETPAKIDEKILWKILRKTLRKALRSLIKTRNEEGQRLGEILSTLLNELQVYRNCIIEKKDTVLEKYRQRLMNKIESFNKTVQAPIDIQRLEAEVLLYADKSDITEELDRLNSHIIAFREKLAPENSDPVGKPLEFLCQEILREVNTIGSKSRDSEIANSVLIMKNAVEKLREQVQNIE